MTMTLPMMTDDSVVICHLSPIPRPKTAINKKQKTKNILFANDYQLSTTIITIKKNKSRSKEKSRRKETEVGTAAEAERK